MDYVVFDIETTGLNKETNRIIEIGAVRVKDGVIIDTYNELLNQNVCIPEEVTAINNITNEMLESGMDPSLAFLKFQNFIMNSEFLVGHNAYYFDYPFLQNEMARNGIELKKYYIKDTMFIAKKKLPGLSSYSLKNLTQHFGIINKDAHRALSDVLATKELFEKLG